MRRIVPFFALLFPALCPAGETPPGEVFYDGMEASRALRGGAVLPSPRPLASPRLRAPAVPSLFEADSIFSNGPSSEKLDVVFLGDGYTSAEQALFRDDARRFSDHLFSQPPFSDRRSLFNAHRVYVISPQSGTDDRCLGVSADTALDAGFHPTGADCRLLYTYSADKVLSAAARAPGYDPGAGLVVVLVNTSARGGAASAGGYVVCPRDGDGPEIMMHELGHSFGLLADEYAMEGAVFQGAEPPQPNVTVQTDRRLVKWARWIHPATPVPTVQVLEDLPGLYEGAALRQYGVFRPTYDSKMRTLYKAYGRVNEALLSERMDKLGAPSVSILSPAVGSRVAGRAEVRVSGTDNVGVAGAALWADGVEVPLDGASSGPSADFRWFWDTTASADGPRTLAVRVWDGAGNAAAGSLQVVVANGSGGGAGPAGPERDGALFLTPSRADGVNDEAEFGPDAYSVAVYDAAGRLVYEAAGGGLRWDGRDGTGRAVESGVYRAQVRGKDGGSFFQTVVVVK